MSDYPCEHPDGIEIYPKIETDEYYEKANIPESMKAEIKAMGDYWDVLTEKNLVKFQGFE